MIHDCGGLCYMDGANMNALIGVNKDGRPKELGFDMCHFNLHKSFAIPHGGGGPGMGPIAVRGELQPYLPEFSCISNVSSISTSPYGSGSILHISNEYLKDFTEKVCSEHLSHILKTTQHVMSELKNIGYDIIHYDSVERAHEFIIDIKQLKRDTSVTEVDISKRLMDYGFHAPTMSWPISSGLMIEVTESENSPEIARFIDAMRGIYIEAYNKPMILKNAPHTQYDIQNWEYEYSIERGCFPNHNDYDIEKYWPTVNRVDDVYGDKRYFENR